MRFSDDSLKVAVGRFSDFVRVHFHESKEEKIAALMSLSDFAGLPRRQLELLLECCDLVVGGDQRDKGVVAMTNGLYLGFLLCLLTLDEEDLKTTLGELSSGPA